MKMQKLGIQKYRGNILMIFKIYWHDPHFNPSKTVPSTGKVSNKADAISFSCTQNCNSDENN